MNDRIEFGTPEAEILGEMAFAGDQPAVAPGVKDALMARVAALSDPGGPQTPTEQDRKGGASGPATADGPEDGADGNGPAGGSEAGGAEVVEIPRRRWARRVMAAAASVALLVAGFAAGHAWTMRGMSQETRFNALNQASDYRSVDHRMADGHVIRLVWSHREHSAALVMPGGMKVPEGKAIQAWLVKGAQTKSMGMYRAGSKGLYTFLDGMPDDGEAVMLTYEPSSGSRRPSSDMVAELPTGKA
jgi:hypothetical protein